MIYNYFCFSGDNKNNYDFNYIIGDNITIQKNEIIKFKLINWSIMNAMLNVSSQHGNNSFRITLDDIDYIITIPDGSYTSTSLRDKLNSLVVDLALAFNYDKLTNKFYIITAEDVLINQLLFYPMNTSLLLGFTKESYNMPYGTYYAESFANMLNYSKICLTSKSLAFNNTTDNNLEVKYKNNSGINEMITWINRDIAPFTTISYYNYENVTYELATQNLKTINFQIMNEYKQVILDAPPSFIQFQLIIEDTTNWYQKFYKLINDIYYSILSLYFK